MRELIVQGKRATPHMTAQLPPPLTPLLRPVSNAGYVYYPYKKNIFWLVNYLKNNFGFYWIPLYPNAQQNDKWSQRRTRIEVEYHAKAFCTTIAAKALFKWSAWICSQLANIWDICSGPYNLPLLNSTTSAGPIGRPNNILPPGLVRHLRKS